MPQGMKGDPAQSCGLEASKKFTMVNIDSVQRATCRRRKHQSGNKFSTPIGLWPR
jgi:hypothetical protein